MFSQFPQVALSRWAYRYRYDDWRPREGRFFYKKRTPLAQALSYCLTVEASGGKVNSATQPSRSENRSDADRRPDGQLMAAVARGDASAFRVIVEQHSGALYRLVYRFTGGSSEAENVVQDVFVKVWSNPTAWRPGPGGGLAAWLRRVTTNRCLDGNYPGLFWAGNQAVTTLRMVWNLLTPGLRRAVSMTVRIPASPWAAHIAR